MNLATDPWIPVLDKQGGAALASLRDALCRGREYRDLAVRPHERVALLRLLLCIAHAALDGPEGKDWPRVPELLSPAAERYLGEWRDSFELFHPQKPFLQIAALQAPPAKVKKGKAQAGESEEGEDGPSVKTSKLDFALATGNASTLFDHEGLEDRRPLPPERLALLLVTYQNFSPGGLIGSVLWGGQATPRTSSDGPCAVGSMLHAFWRGANVLETLHHNLCHKKMVQTEYHALGEDFWGRPVWERMPQGPGDEAALANATRTYLGRLAPLSRLVLLRRDGASMLLGAGPVYPNCNSPKEPFPAEPTATVVLRGKDKKETRALLSLRLDRAVWRDLHALLAYRQDSGQRGFWAAHLGSGRCRDLLVAAMARDQAEVVDTLESVYHIPAAMHEDQGLEQYRQGVAEAERQASLLGYAVDACRRAVDGGWEGRLKGAGAKKAELQGQLRYKALLHYWSAAEQRLPLLFDAVGALGSDAFPAAWAKWRGALFGMALAAYDEFCAPRSARQYRAYALGRGQLFKSKDPVDNGPEQDNEEESA